MSLDPMCYWLVYCTLLPLSPLKLCFWRPGRRTGSHIQPAPQPWQLLQQLWAWACCSSGPSQGPSCPSLMRLQMSEHSIRLIEQQTDQIRKLSSLWWPTSSGSICYSEKKRGCSASSSSTHQYCRLRKPSLNTTRGLRTPENNPTWMNKSNAPAVLVRRCRSGGWCFSLLFYLLTLRGPSPGAPPPPRMQVPTHLVVHCNALADLGCLIRSCFPSPPAHHQLLLRQPRWRYYYDIRMPKREKVAKHVPNVHVCTHRRAWAGRWRRCPPGAPSSRGWPREPAPPRPVPPAPTSPGPGACVASALRRRADADGEMVALAVAGTGTRQERAHRGPWPRGIQV